MVIDGDAGGNVETSGTFDPQTNGIDFYESLEGMLVEVRDPVVVGLRNARGEIPVLPNRGANARVRPPRGGIVLRDGDANPERMILDNGIVDTPAVNVGDVFAGAVTGVMDYGFGAFHLVTTSLPAATPGGLMRETAMRASANHLATATFNLENLDPGDGAAKFAALAEEIVTNLGAPDLIGLEEVQDNSGPIRDGVVDATTTFTMLTDAIVAAGGPRYEFRNIPPVDRQDGGEPGGNIRVGLLFRADGGLIFIDRAGGDSTTAVQVTSGAGNPTLSASPGRIDPTNPAFAQSRKPLVAELRYNEHPLFVVVVHLVSRLGDDPLFGRFQPPTLRSADRRGEQARVVHDFVAELLAADPGARVIVLGDFNDYQFAPALAEVVGGELRNLTDTLPEEERYSFIYEGNGQAIDHILVSPRLFTDLVEYDIVHVNTEFVDQASDHDPARALFLLPP
jgi:predicted extracellular nuclease